MNIRSLLTLGLFVCTGIAHAQTFLWVAPVVGGGSGRAVAVDADGNVYTCGNAFGQVDFDPGPGEALSPPGTGVNGDICVVKYTNDGNYVWHYMVGGSSADVAKNIVVDGNGDVLVTGYFNSGFDWDPGPGTAIPPSNYLDCFVLKISSAGEFMWVQSIGGPGEDQDHGLAVDAANNVYVTGYSSAAITFGGGDTTLAHVGGLWNGYYAKYSADGVFRWAKSISGPGNQRGFSVACAGEHVYLYGSYKGTTTVNGTHTITGPDVRYSTYLCKTDTAGTVRWIRGQTAEGEMNGEVVRANGTNVYVFASFHGTVDADPGSGSLELVPPSPSAPQTLFAKLDTSGNAIWAHQLQGNIHFDTVGDIALDPNGGVVVTCAIAQTQDYDPGPGEAIYTPVQPNDLFTAQYAVDGGFQWVRMVTTGESFDTANGAAVDALGNVYMTGSFGDSAVFDPGPLGTIRSANSSQAFTVKYGFDPTTGLAGRSTPPALQLSPNPVRGILTLAGAFERGDVLLVLDAEGREVMRPVVQDHVMRISVQHLFSGIYTLVWISEKGRRSERFVVM